MALQIPFGSSQTISVTVRDNSELLTTLVGSEPHYSVYAVDPTTDLDTTLVIDSLLADVVNTWTINCVVETQYENVNGVAGYGIAANAPTVTFPYTVTAGVNDQYLVSTIFYGMQVVPPGTYANIDAYCLAMSNALGQFNYGYSYAYAIDEALGVFTYDKTIGRIRFDTYADSTLNGLTISNGTHNFLAASGWTSGQILVNHALSPSGVAMLPLSSPLTAGKYRLYVSFSSGTFVVPRVGPVEFFVI